MSLGTENVARYAAPVVATVEMLYQSGIEREDLILYDDAVLALEGIKQAHVARFIVEPSVFTAMWEDRQTPRRGNPLEPYRERGAPLENHLRTIDPLAKDCLPVDLTTFIRGDRQERFRNLLERTDYSPSLGIAQFSLGQTLHDKSHSLWPANRLDAFRIGRHLGKSKLEACLLAIRLSKSSHSQHTLI